MTKDGSRIEFFDFLRAVAILSVFLTHAYSPSLPGGYLGVFVFFPISGYLIAASVTQSTKRAFLFKRFFRIYIPFGFWVFVWAILALAYGSFPASEVWPALVDNLLVFQIRSEFGYSTAVLWTLHVEMWFYLLIPFLLAFDRVTSTRLIVVLGVFSLLLRLQFVELPKYAFVPMLYNFACFVPGVLVYLWRDRIPKTRIDRQLVGVGFTILLVFFALDSKPTEMRSTVELLTSIVTAWIMSCCLQGNVKLDVPGMTFVGLVSYSLYLVHGIVLDFRFYFPVRDALDFLGFYDLVGSSGHSIHGRLLLTFAISIALAGASYLVLEKAGIRLGRLLASRYAGNSERKERRLASGVSERTFLSSLGIGWITNRYFITAARRVGLLVVALVVVDVSLGFLGWEKRDPRVRVEFREPGTLESDPWLGWRSRSQADEPGLAKVWLLGSSYVAGYGLASDMSLASVMSDQAGAADTENLAVPLHSAHQSSMILMSLLDRGHSPAAVVYGLAAFQPLVSNLNDANFVGSLVDGSRNQIVPPYLSSEGIAVGARLFEPWPFESSSTLLSWLHSLQIHRAQREAAAAAGGYERVYESLERMQAHSESKGVPLYVAFLDSADAKAIQRISAMGARPLNCSYPQWRTEGTADGATNRYPTLPAYVFWSNCISGQLGKDGI